MKKLIDSVINHKILIVVFGVILFLVVLIINKETLPSVPISSPTPPSQTQLPLLLEQTIPTGATKESIWPVEPVTFVFSLPIQVDSISYEIDPQIEAKIIFNGNTPNQFSIIPLTTAGWEANKKYLITVKSVEAVSGAALASPIYKEFTRLFDPEDLPNI